MENYTSGSRSLCKTNREGYERADDFHDKVSRHFCMYIMLCKTNREGYERADDFHDKVSRHFCMYIISHRLIFLESFVINKHS